MTEAYPLHWPLDKARTPEHARTRAKFGKQSKKEGHGGSWNSTRPITLSEAIKRVLAELDRYTPVGIDYRVPPDSIVISSNVPLKKDGLPYSGGKQPKDPGVAVFFKLDNRDYCLPCDKWDRVEDNVAAVAAHINAMRGIERWGVGERHDAYAGYKALPESTMSEKQIWDTLGLPAKPASVDTVKDAYRKQVQIHHPDKPSGSADAFHKLQRAYQFALKFYQ